MCPRYKCGQQNNQHLVIITQNCFLVSNLSPQDILNLEILVFHSPLWIYLPWDCAALWKLLNFKAMSCSRVLIELVAYFYNLLRAVTSITSSKAATHLHNASGAKIPVQIVSSPFKTLMHGSLFTECKHFNLPLRKKYCWYTCLSLYMGPAITFLCQPGIFFLPKMAIKYW